jgi:hypothetical protein
LDLVVAGVTTAPRQVSANAFPAVNRGLWKWAVAHCPDGSLPDSQLVSAMDTADAPITAQSPDVVVNVPIKRAVSIVINAKVVIMEIPAMEALVENVSVMEKPQPAIPKVETVIVSQKASRVPTATNVSPNTLETPRTRSLVHMN